MDEFRRNQKHITMGIVFIVAGAAFLLKNLGILPDFIIENFFNWKTLIILIGAVLLFNDRRKISGIVLISIGSFFLLPDIFDLPFNFRHLFWPTIFIFVGVYIIFMRRGRHYFDGEFNAEDDEIIEGTAFFGGGKKKVTTPFFRGGTLTVIFGGQDIDLSDADLSEGVNVLDVFVLFGGIKLIVPSDWDIDVKASVALGGINDKRYQQSFEVMPGKTLVIDGLIMFGGCDIISSHVKYK